MSKIELKVCILRVILGKNNGRNGRISDGKNDVYKVFDKTSSSRLIKQERSVREYYDAFTSHYNVYISWTRKMGLDDGCLVMSGLQPEIEKMVYFQPKTLHDAYLLAKLLEMTIEILKDDRSKGDEKVNSELAGCHEGCKENANGERKLNVWNCC